MFLICVFLEDTEIHDMNELESRTILLQNVRDVEYFMKHVKRDDNGHVNCCECTYLDPDSLRVHLQHSHRMLAYVLKYKAINLFLIKSY